MAEAERLRARDQRLPPRGLNREQAAAYIGIGASLFDTLVDEGLMPPPKVMGGRRVWDIHEVDQAFDQLPHADPFQRGDRTANSAVNDWN